MIKAKELSVSYYLPIAGGISAKGNENSFVQDLNLGCQLLFLNNNHGTKFGTNFGEVVSLVLYHYTWPYSLV